jgi:3-oxoacyl-[acyl-carrier-protein] synthase-3
LTNAELETMVDTTSEWILTRTGIQERRIASSEESASSFGIPAAAAALESAGVGGEEVDLVICATVTSDMLFPATASLIQNAIGARGAAAFDLGAGCSGFVYGLGVAAKLIEGGAAKTAVVVGAEVLSKIIDWDDRATCVIFGDGAGAVVLRATDEERGVLYTAMHSDGSLAELIHMPGGGSKHPPSREVYDSKLPFIKMRGNEVFKVAVRSLAEVSDEVLRACGLHRSDVRWFIPHQANRRIIDAVGQRLEIPEDRLYVNIERFGNTSAASIPIALDELREAGKIEDGDILLFSAFGAGLTWGATVIRW